jgi:hypothetical protein
MKTLSQLQKIIKQAQGTTGTTAYRPKGGDEQQFMDKHIIQKTDDANGNGDEVFSGTGVNKVDRKKERHGYEPGEDAAVHEEKEINERELSKGEMKKREDIVKGMKKGLKDFKSRYGKDAKSVMYATATKLAKEEVTQEEYDVQFLELFASLDEENKQFMLEMLDKGLEKEILEFIKESEGE